MPAALVVPAVVPLAALAEQGSGPANGSGAEKKRHLVASCY